MTRRILALLALAAPVFCQSEPASPAFEVVSVKVHPLDPSGPPLHPSISHSPGRLTMQNVSLNAAMAYAYRVQDFLVLTHGLAGPYAYDIFAKAPGPATEAELRRMLQTLLADRFKLQFHRGEQEIQATVMTVAKGGPKFKESADDGDADTQSAKSFLHAESRRTSMAELATLLEGPLGSHVVDQTGLAGRYDFTLDISPYQVDGKIDDLPGVVATAVEREFGLKLERRKVSVEMLIVDHVERPAEN